MIKKFLAFILALGCAASVYGQNSALAQLGAAGVTEVGGDPMYAHYVIRLGTNGCLSATLMPPGFQTMDWSRGVFIDPVNGDDLETQTGSAVAPYKTITYASANFAGRTNGSLVYILAPGTHPSATLDVGLNNSLANVTFWGYDPQRTHLAELRFVTAGTAIDINVNVKGIHVLTFYQGNNKGVTLKLADGAYIDSLTKAYGGSNWSVHREPNCYVTTFSHAYTNVFTHNATNMGYNGTNSTQWWGDTPITIAMALNSLAARPYTAAGTNQGEMVYWNGTNWAPYPAGTTNDFLIGGSVPSFTRRYIWPGTNVGQLVHWDGTNWAPVTSTTNSSYVLFGGNHPYFGQALASQVAYTNAKLIYTNVDQALNDLVLKTTSWTNSAAYGITLTDTSFWSWAAASWSNSPARGITSSDTNLWTQTAITVSNSAAFGITAGDTNFWTWTARGWSNSAAYTITAPDIIRWNNNGTNVYYNYADTALFTNAVEIANTNYLASNIISNGGFAGNADGWLLVDAMYFGDRVLVLPGSLGTLTTTNAFSALAGKTYCMTAEIIGTNFVTVMFGDSTQRMYAGSACLLHSGIIPTNLQIRAYGGPTFGTSIDNVTVSEVTRGELYVAGDAHIGGDLIVGNTNSIKFGNGISINAQDALNLGTLNAGASYGIDPAGNLVSNGVIIRIGPIVVTNTYTGTNVYTDASQGSIFDLRLTNNAKLHMPSNMASGRSIRWRITQGTGTNTMSVATNLVFPTGISALTLSEAVGSTDVLIAEAVSTNRALLTGMLKFSP